MHQHLLHSAAVLAASAASAGADVVRYDFTGTVSFVSAQSPYGVVAQFGDPVVGWFIYDDQVADTTPGDPFFGSYPNLFDGGFTFYINNTNVHAGAYTVLVTDDNPPNNTFDELEVYATEGVIVDGVPQPSADMYVQLRDDTGTVFNSDALPGWDLTLADFPDNDGIAPPNGYLLDVSSGNRIEFLIDSLVGIPAPATLSVGALALLIASRRRRA